MQGLFNKESILGVVCLNPFIDSFAYQHIKFGEMLFNDIPEMEAKLKPRHLPFTNEFANPVVESHWNLHDNNRIRSVSKFYFKLKCLLHLNLVLLFYHHLYQIYRNQSP